MDKLHQGISEEVVCSTERFALLLQVTTNHLFLIYRSNQNWKPVFVVKITVNIFGSWECCYRNVENVSTRFGKSILDTPITLKNFFITFPERREKCDF